MDNIEVYADGIIFSTPIQDSKVQTHPSLSLNLADQFRVHAGGRVEVQYKIPFIYIDFIFIQITYKVELLAC